jgi:protein TonB
MKNYRLLVIVVFLVSNMNLFASKDTIPNKDDEEKIYLFDDVDIKPEFPKGEEEMTKWISKNVKYPIDARTIGIEGTVFVTFVVEKNGEISNIRILRGIFESCNKEVLRVVGLFPKWNPGKINGEFVRVQFNLPIRFILNDGKKNKKKRKKKDKKK